MCEHLKEIFPNLKQGGFSVTSPQTEEYNCIAWAAEDIRYWWWPTEHPKHYWPSPLTEETTTNFIQVFQELGYELCENEIYEAGYEKVALYADSQGTPTHMARQMDTGEWTSKLGDYEDISHHSLRAIEGDDYGVAKYFMKRLK